LHKKLWMKMSNAYWKVWFHFSYCFEALSVVFLE
jgi:hypothetical protein